MPWESMEVHTTLFHGGNTGSSPVGDTKQINELQQ